MAAQYGALMALMGHGATNAFPGVHATRHLYHHLRNVELDYVIDLEAMLRSVPSARDKALIVQRQGR